MTSLHSTTVAQGDMLTRAQMRPILHASMGAKAYRFARRAAEIWLEKYPGDIEISAIQAHAMIEDKRGDLALPLLKRLAIVDPLYVYTQKLLWHTTHDLTFSPTKDALGALYVLGEVKTVVDEIPEWAHLLWDARGNLDMGQIDDAHLLVEKALELHPHTPLAAIFSVKIAQQREDALLINRLLHEYHQRWPDTLFFSMQLADELMGAGDEEQAVALLHQAAAQDVTGQVASRIWRKQHPYAALWPRKMQVALNIPIPANVAGKLGWNQLPQGEQVIDKSTESFPVPRPAPPTSSAPPPESLLDIREELERIGKQLRKPNLASSDIRFPVYIVLTSQEGLENKYGAENLAVLDKAMKQVVKSTESWRNWGARLIYVDDAQSTDALGIPPAKDNAPWAIKNLLADLDQALRKRGEMIGAVLIVGGPEVVPFHHLPNPVDDADVDVPSDNPYSTPDENYFIPLWPVGRLPGGKSKSPAMLIKLLENIVSHRHELQSKRHKRSMIPEWLRKLFPFRQVQPSFGYTAEVWQRASHAVYRPIGKPQHLVISPPTDAQRVHKRNGKPVQLSYYNLHGLEDSPEWFGQRDPFADHDGPDYPVALRPKDIVNSGRAPQIVFSEACYGANVFDKGVEDAIALKFLASGTMAVAGSTVTAYGSVTTPLIAADLLGKAFWKLIKEGYPVGEAMLRAKVHLAREMHKQQGYLDGEDQKTLLSFVLYGDPLAQPHVHGATPKAIRREQVIEGPIHTVCDKVNPNIPTAKSLPPQILSEVKSLVQEHLPGMGGSQVLYSQEHVECEGHNCPLPEHAHKAAKNLPLQKRGRQVVTLSKSVKMGQRKHPKFARMTFDKEGNLVKLAISR